MVAHGADRCKPFGIPINRIGLACGPGQTVLGAPSRAWPTHIVLFRAVWIESRDNELPPEIGDLGQDADFVRAVLDAAG